MTKSLVVGIDAADWGRIESLFERGELPNIATIRDKGTIAPLESTIPPMTPPAWSSIVTGVTPDKHGVTDFLSQNRDNYEVTPNRDVRLNRPAIWDAFSQEGRDIGFVNFPVVYPPPATNGVFISGIPHDRFDDIVRPKGFRTELEDTEYRVHPAVSRDDPETYFEELERLATRRCELTERLLQGECPETLWVVFMVIDWVQHYLWGTEINGEDAVDAMYRHVDDLVGKLVGTADDDRATVVISDHGATKIKHIIHMNSLLAQEGFLAKREDRTTKQTVEKITDFLIDLTGKLPDAMKGRLKDHISTEDLESLRKAAGRGQRDLHRAIDWSSTEVFSFGNMGQLYVHRQDWYPEGKVPPEEYEAVRDEVIDILERVTVDGQQKLFERVVRAEQVGRDVGPETPDLFSIPRDRAGTIYGDFGDEWIEPPDERIADHDDVGVFMMADPAVEVGRVDDLHVVDVAPTLLYFHGMPIPPGVDGDVRKDMFTADFRSEHEVHYFDEGELEVGDTETDRGSDEQINSHLKELGYL